MSFFPSPNKLRLLAITLAAISLVVLATEIEARGRRGGGGGGRGISRGGPARGGSIRNQRSGGGYRSREPSRARGGSRSWGDRSSTSERSRSRWDDSGTRSRDGSFETRRGETIDYSGTVSRTDDGLHREGSWQSSSGASGGGSADIGVRDGQVQSTDRSRHAESASGETMKREVQSERHGDHIDREGKIKTSTGIDAESKGTFQKTDDGFIARGGIVGEKGAIGGTIVRDGDHTYARGAATDGDSVAWGRVHCSGSHCRGGRVTVGINDYYRYPYYYYPYYYGWYSCPIGGTQIWHSRYGTPVYGCANVIVIHTTISLGVAETSSVSGHSAALTSGPKPWPAEAAVSSAPVLMYEISPAVVLYATTYVPPGVYSVKQNGRHFFAPGPAHASAEAKKSIAAAGAMTAPTANATVITYAIGERTVYLTNERPLPDFYAETADPLFVWIPGVLSPTDEERDLIETVITAHRLGGKNALDREVRKLEANREPPPSAVPAKSS